MINAAKLLADLKRLRKVLDADLRVAHAAGAQRHAAQAEWREALDLGRTRDTFEVFLDSAFDQSVVHWLLGCVFLRFLEDNLLVDRPFLSGPGERLDLAKERQEAHFRARPHDSDTEYLLTTFAEAARLPGMSGLFDPAHNPLFRLPLSGDGAMALIRFFREVLPETGELAHDFTDPNWGTRFLGDLYQDLSEEARKRYALLQTPNFVEAWILDRTLEPAIREFGYERVTMIDPACGSGHFLLGGFDRLMREWRRFAPGLPPTEQAQRALDGIAGVDLNPFAVEIARFRLLMAALRAAGVNRLASAPGFRLHLAAGDSLLHGRHFFRNELGGIEEGFGRVLRHHYAVEDTAEIDHILGRQYHAVVGNPPYITPKDPAMRDAYREIYDSCHRKYGLGAPFIERFFDLARVGFGDQVAGFVGLIVANSFMKREFGSKLIEEVLPHLDLTHVIDCSGAYIPGHGTPTVILFGRNRLPVDIVVRTVRGIRGEPSTPADPALGDVWSAIVAQIDVAESTSDFVSSEDTPREALTQHPWNMGGGGAAAVQERIESDRQPLATTITEIGFGSIISEEEAFLLAGRRDVPASGLSTRQFVIGEKVRDWRLQTSGAILFPYDENISLSVSKATKDFLWPLRSLLLGRRDFGNRSYADVGRSFAEYHQIPVTRNRSPLTITFAFVATHNHFVFDRSSRVFNRSAPVIKLPTGASDNDYIGLLGLLNSSTACFWMKQIFHNKGSTVDDKGARQRTDPFEDFYEFTGTGLQNFPLAAEHPLDLARTLDVMSQQLAQTMPDSVCAHGVPTRETLKGARAAWESIHPKMVAIQEELDWRCYRLYGLLEEDLEQVDPPLVRLGERAFEIVMARGLAAGTLETTWFVRHGSTPVCEVPTHWPESYRAVVERRIALIESNNTIGLIEKPEYKRRWSHEGWDDMERDALRLWLLGRLECPRIWGTGDPRLLSTNQLADLMRRDAEFLSVATLYVGRPDVALETLVAELVAKESVPFLAALRYADTGLRKRVQWEATWAKQRREDAIDADVASHREEFRTRAERRAHEQWRVVNPRRLSEEPESYAIRMNAGAAESVEQAIEDFVVEEQRRRKRDEIGDIPVPPKYVTKDFQSSDFWRLRGSLDVPKERFVSFPHCQRDADGSLVVTWAGHDYLKRALAIAAYYQERKDNEGWSSERLVPLLAGVMELLPWLLQWRNDYDPDLGARMGNYFVDFVQSEARALGMTEAAVAAWKPPARSRRRRTAA
ncbi:BREX-2 system adenine-specific DNA-methyltransferase PglX [Sinorhizobium meliloti]|nr:BREX-2 system adenine-specific DNA-methyltransferase PglX [Sinorhizobium meliloti]MDW9509476.1 BREX-2 system adenine-specific DNA-methyltransferase PglX [Sinorhizobium meliloti]MDX0772249.1 BREX-2 system adenine-specific DNA-methyltransferase PglX [Sinorhizobium medicae]MDX0906722.1 BREX-2 system adenine-specific DNA-methyltransferase PglX [Sinorhizobium medicae]MDX1164196.1 BREX-2 system adenine-specific DNA-methyltransferase PglX [Sinorhizobium medicae]